MESGTARFETLEDVPLNRLKKIDDRLVGMAVPCTYIFCNIMAHHKQLRAELTNKLIR